MRCRVSEEGGGGEACPGPSGQEARLCGQTLPPSGAEMVSVLGDPGPVTTLGTAGSPGQEAAGGCFSHRTVG